MANQVRAADQRESRRGSQQQRDSVDKMLKDPEKYYDEARRWAGRKAEAEVQAEMARRRKGR